MPISVVCNTCNSGFTVSDKFAGKTGPCPKCKSPVKVPNPTADAPTDKDAVVGCLLIVALTLLPPLVFLLFGKPTLLPAHYFLATVCIIACSCGFLFLFLAIALWAADSSNTESPKPDKEMNYMMIAFALALVAWGIYPLRFEPKWTLSPNSTASKDASVAEEAAPEGTLQQGQVAKNSLDLSKPSSGTWAGLLGFHVDPTPDSFREFVEHEIQSIPSIAPALKPRDSYKFDLKKTNSVVAPYEGVFVVECQSEHGDANVGITCTYTVEANYGLIDGTWTCRSVAVTEGVPIPFNKHLSEPANSPAYRMAEARVRSMSKLISQARANKPANIIAFQKLEDMSRGDWGTRLAKVLMLNR